MKVVKALAEEEVQVEVERYGQVGLGPGARLCCGVTGRSADLAARRSGKEDIR